MAASTRNTFQIHSWSLHTPPFTKSINNNWKFNSIQYVNKAFYTDIIYTKHEVDDMNILIEIEIDNTLLEHKDLKANWSTIYDQKYDIHQFMLDI